MNFLKITLYLWILNHSNSSWVYSRCLGGLKIEKFVGFEGHISELGEPSSVSKRGVQNIRTKKYIFWRSLMDSILISFNSYWRPIWKRAEKMWLSGWERLGRRCWAWRVPARCPSTEESGRWTLLCETSLTRCTPALGTQTPRPSPEYRGTTPNLERASQLDHPTKPYQPSQANLQSH